MKTEEAIKLGECLAGLVQAGDFAGAETLLNPILAERTRFVLLGRIGANLGIAPLEAVNLFLERIAAGKTEGGWVVIASALGAQLHRDFSGAFARCHAFIVGADVWYATDILGERVPGPALVSNFQPALDQLASWRVDTNRWIRRTVGVAVHFWAKRAHGANQSIPYVQEILDFLEPMFEERDIEAVKGVGWGLKTLGRYYPSMVKEWLDEQNEVRKRPHRALMIRKATTYLEVAHEAKN